MNITPSVSLLSMVIAFLVAVWGLVHRLRLPFRRIPYHSGSPGLLMARNANDLPSGKPILKGLRITVKQLTLYTRHLLK